MSSSFPVMTPRAGALADRETIARPRRRVAGSLHAHDRGPVRHGRLSRVLGLPLNSNLSHSRLSFRRRDGSVFHAPVGPDRMAVPPSAAL